MKDPVYQSHDRPTSQSNAIAFFVICGVSLAIGALAWAFVYAGEADEGGMDVVGKWYIPCQTYVGLGSRLQIMQISATEMKATIFEHTDQDCMDLAVESGYVYNHTLDRMFAPHTGKAWAQDRQGQYVFASPKNNAGLDYLESRKFAGYDDWKDRSSGKISLVDQPMQYDSLHIIDDYLYFGADDGKHAAKSADRPRTPDKNLRFVPWPSSDGTEEE